MQAHQLHFGLEAVASRLIAARAAHYSFKSNGHNPVYFFCEIFYFLTNITYTVLHTDRTIFPIPFSALFLTALLPANALVSLALLVLCVEDMCCVTTQVHAHMMPSWCLITGCQLKIVFR